MWVRPLESTHGTGGGGGDVTHSGGSEGGAAGGVNPGYSDYSG